MYIVKLHISCTNTQYTCPNTYIYCTNTRHEQKISLYIVHTHRYLQITFATKHDLKICIIDARSTLKEKKKEETHKGGNKFLTQN